MSNYNYRSQFSFSNAAKAVTLRASVSIGASGAPTLVSGTGMGISAISRNSAGDYSITLSHNFQSLMGLHVMFNSGSSAPAAPLVNIESNSVSSGSLRIQCRDIAGAAADPANGEIMMLEIVLNESSLAY